MRVEDLIRCSLQKTKVEKLVVLLGFLDYARQSARSAAACRLEEILFRQCQPPLNDVHNPDRCRVAARDAAGVARAYYEAHTRSLASKRSRRAFSATALRKPQQWDSSPVVDYMGVWCDRLLLGEETRPSRTALLRPCVPPFFQAEAIQRVAHAEPHLKASDVLLVDATPHLPFGVVRLFEWEALRRCCAELHWEGSLVRRHWLSGDSRGMPAGEAGHILTPSTPADPERLAGNSIELGISIEDVVRQFQHRTRTRGTWDECLGKEGTRVPEREITPPSVGQLESVGQAEHPPAPPIRSGPHVLMIGCGNLEPPLSQFSPEEEKYLTSMLLPLSAFAVALWTVNPSLSTAYLERQTRTPFAYDEASAGALFPGPSAKNMRQWRTMQCAMLSTRDTALLRAHFTRTRLDRRLSVAQQTYLAETLLRRLEERDKEGE